MEAAPDLTSPPAALAPRQATSLEQLEFKYYARKLGKKPACNYVKY